MTDLNFDLNIYNYTNAELKKFLCIENNYNIDILKKKINILKKNIFSSISFFNIFILLFKSS